MEDEAEVAISVPSAISCPLCKCDTISYRMAHSLLEEEQHAGYGTGKLIRRTVTDIFHYTRDQLSQEVMVHNYCWSITERVFKKHSFHQAWIEDFKDCIHFMRPFMTSAPFGSSCEAKSLDRDVFLVLKSSKPKMQPRNRFHMPLPPEIIQMIYDFLGDDDAINLSRVIYIGPCPEWWEQLRAKYMLPDDSDIQANMTTMVENLRKMPQSRYPKTANYRTIWKNMELVRDTMRYPTTWHELSATAPVGHHMILENSGNSSRFSIHLPERLYLVLIFAESEDVQFLCGIVLNGLLIGYEEGTWIPVSVKSFRGLRAFSIKDGFVGIQVNDFGAWKTQWHGGYPPASSHTQLQLEWNSPDCELVISYDEVKITELGIRSGPK